MIRRSGSNRSEVPPDSLAELRVERAGEPSVHPGDPGAQCGASPEMANLPINDRDLLPLVQTEILPGLHLKYGPSIPAGRPGSDAGPELDPAFLNQFADHLVMSDLVAAWACVESVRSQGATADWIALTLFTQTAVELGTRWEDDRNNFAEVTIAMSHLSAFLRRNSEEYPACRQQHRVDCRILMSPAPGEQHTFGLSIASEYFMRAGFDVHTHGESSVDGLVDHIREQSFDIVGLSLGSLRNQDALAVVIRRLRRASRQRALGIIVGGPLFGLHPDLYRQVGADLMIIDIREAPLRVMKLVQMLTRRHGGR